MPIPVTEMGIPDHLSALYDRVARLERRKIGGGVSGWGNLHTSHSFTIAVSGNAAINTGWVDDGGVGNYGVSLVSGQPTYAPGVYAVQFAFVLSSPSDGHSGETHVLTVTDALLGSLGLLFANNLGAAWTVQGNYYFTTATASGLNVAYDLGDSASTQITVSSTNMYVMRLGDVPA